LAAEGAFSAGFRQFLRMVKFEHTIFGLPFVFMGGVLAAGGMPSARASFAIVSASTHLLRTAAPEMTIRLQSL